MNQRHRTFTNRTHEFYGKCDDVMHIAQTNSTVVFLSSRLFREGVLETMGMIQRDGAWRTGGTVGDEWGGCRAKRKASYQIQQKVRQWLSMARTLNCQCTPSWNRSEWRLSIMLCRSSFSRAKMLSLLNERMVFPRGVIRVVASSLKVFHQYFRFSPSLNPQLVRHPRHTHPPATQSSPSMR